MHFGAWYIEGKIRGIPELTKISQLQPKDIHVELHGELKLGSKLLVFTRACWVPAPETHQISENPRHFKTRQAVKQSAQPEILAQAQNEVALNTRPETLP